MLLANPGIYIKSSLAEYCLLVVCFPKVASMVLLMHHWIRGFSQHHELWCYLTSIWSLNDEKDAEIHRTGSLEMVITPQMILLSR
jgi:hypothetical protein